MKIDLYSDMVCPWCRIGKSNLYDALAQWEAATGETIPVTYHAYQLDPSLPPEGKPFKSHMGQKFGGEDKIAPMLARVTEAGAAVGVTFRFDNVTRMPNTVLAHRLTVIVPEDLRAEWVEAVMKAYFEDGLDIASLDVLLAIGNEIDGADTTDWVRRLESGEGNEEINRDFEMARGMGITGVPFFVVNGKFALSGAYPASQFLAAFRKIAQETGA
ncbi:DsbA family protein [Cohnella faecalis]|uniref:DsbA family oxidoreductase n=1 Tax=Cohnella faecalis TaxID=2315694 RepID=A0A398CHZ0_9BACL|nr:DsbA family oxidoreductase [Cohnella faecalis]RIE01944.1 DsbA family oxidoreductase [Cohnella faecalis]RIE01955.1 DsbA family oxidoreductase [Cohnella faecalis]RIE01958.1 DsbA family oxidoreductase [Cohnella faecalis]